ncbi:YadA-like C-terminal region, partial [Acinetobacter boissieri]
AVQADGTVSQPSYSVGGSSYNNVGGAISAVDTRVGNLESAFAQTNQQMNKLRNDTNAGIAGAIAIASLGQPIEKGASALSLGTGVWNNSTNLAVGASGVTEDHKIFGKPVNYIWKMAGTSDFKGNSGGGGSVTVTWK